MHRINRFLEISVYVWTRPQASATSTTKHSGVLMQKYNLSSIKTEEAASASVNLGVYERIKEVTALNKCYTAYFSSFEQSYSLTATNLTNKRLIFRHLNAEMSYYVAKNVEY